MSWIQTKEKREQRAKLVQEAGEMLKQAHRENRELTSDENARFESLHKDGDKLLAEIEQTEKQERAEKSVEERIGREDFEVSEGKRSDLSRRAFDKFLRHGHSGLTVEERALLERRAMSAGTATEGAEFVPEDFHSTFVQRLNDVADVRSAGPTIITTSSGRDYPIPILDDTANTGERIGENAPVGEGDPDTASLMLKAFIYSSKVVKCSRSLVADTAFDVQGWLSPILAARIANKLNTDLTVGAGGGTAPQGCVTGSTLGKSAAASNAVTYNEILDTVHSLPRVYRNGARFMFNDSTLLAVRKLVDGDGNSLFQHGRYDQGMPDTIAGYPYTINSAMPDLEEGEKPILFANFKIGYVVRDVVGMELFVFAEKYMDSLQHGYLAWSRHDGGVIVPNAIKHVLMASS